MTFNPKARMQETANVASCLASMAFNRPFVILVRDPEFEMPLRNSGLEIRQGLELPQGFNAYAFKKEKRLDIKRTTMRDGEPMIFPLHMFQKKPGAYATVYVKFILDDKRLEDTLRALAGLLRGNKEPKSEDLSSLGMQQILVQHALYPQVSMNTR
ncbi:MAG TPA: hypothetical protein VL945_02765 [Candidatus Saccharimonadales bacterium]|nr:hypothetical protein [Candidatus Saccharimonadales bacterium]